MIRQKTCLMGIGKRHTGIFCFCRSKAYQFSSAEGESGGHKYRTHALEHVGKCPWIVPCVGSEIMMCRSTTDVDHKREDAAKLIEISEDMHQNKFLKRANVHEAEGGDDLDNREDEFCFAVTSHAEEVDGDDHEEKDSHPDAGVDTSCSTPIIQCYGGGHDLNGKGE